MHIARTNKDKDQQFHEGRREMYDLNADEQDTHEEKTKQNMDSMKFCKS
jgi:hypothetical protein